MPISAMTKPSRSLSKGRLARWGVVVEAGGEGAGLVEAGDGEGDDLGLRPAGDDGVGPAELDRRQGHADGVVARGAGRGDGHPQAPDPELHADVPGGGVGHQHRHGERADPLGPPGLADVLLVDDRLQAADAGGEEDADAVAVVVVHHQPGRRDGLAGGGDGELPEAVHAPGGAGVHEVDRVEALDLAGDVRLQAQLHRIEAGDAGESRTAPALSRGQVSGMECARGLTEPTPVITTRRRSTFAPLPLWCSAGQRVPGPARVGLLQGVRAAPLGHLAAVVQVEAVVHGADVLAVAVAGVLELLPVPGPGRVVRRLAVDGAPVPVLDLASESGLRALQGLQHGLVRGVVLHDLLELVRGDAEQARRRRCCSRSWRCRPPRCRRCGPASCRCCGGGR